VGGFPVQILKFSKFAFLLRFPSGFCISNPLLALKIRILAAVPKWFLHFKPFAGTQNSHSRCGSVVNSAFQALCWHSKFTFPLRFRSEFCISSPLLELKIRILAAVP
jgi:hypothetical protein